MAFYVCSDYGLEKGNDDYGWIVWKRVISRYCVGYIRQHGLWISMGFEELRIENWIWEFG